MIKKTIKKTFFLLITFLFVFQTALGEEGEKTSPSPLAIFNSYAFSILFFDLSLGAIQIDEVNRSGDLVLDENGDPVKRTVPLPLSRFILIGRGYFFYL